jgi:hypothetical protein
MLALFAALMFKTGQLWAAERRVLGARRGVRSSIKRYETPFSQFGDGFCSVPARLDMILQLPQATERE